jgi:hypothetical protein
MTSGCIPADFLSQLCFFKLKPGNCKRWSFNTIHSRENKIEDFVLFRVQLDMFHCIYL